MNISKAIKMRVAAAGLVVAVFGMSACGNLLDVDNPGLIGDEALDQPGFAGALVEGMSADFSRAMNPGISRYASVMAYEMTAGISDQGEHVIGYLDGDIVDRQGSWEHAARARWVASAGVVRLKESLGTGYESSILAARANLYAGFSNRLLGENMCFAVIDGGAVQDRSVHFSIAEGYFTEAARIAVNAGDDDTRFAAFGGRASVRAWQGNWSGAVEDAKLVPGEFVWEAEFSSAGVVNEIFSEQYLSRYLTMQGSVWLDIPGFDEGQDPRMPWSKTKLLDDQGVAPPTRGGGWRTWPETKYNTRDSNVPVTHGAEMLVLRAEAALRAGDIAGMTDRLNDSRALARWKGLLDPLPVPASVDEAWEVFMIERLATIWLEYRAFWDRARWFDEGRDDILQGRAKCHPIAQKEIDSNPNIDANFPNDTGDAR